MDPLGLVLSVLSRSTAILPRGLLFPSGTILCRGLLFMFTISSGLPDPQFIWSSFNLEFLASLVPSGSRLFLGLRLKSKFNLDPFPSGTRLCLGLRLIDV